MTQAQSKHNWSLAWSIRSCLFLVFPVAADKVLCWSKPMPLRTYSLLILFTCSSALAAPWGKNMQSLFQSLQELLVFAVDEAQFNDSKNASRIASAAEALMASAHSVTSMQSKSPDRDPSLGIFASYLKDESERAYEAYRAGHKDYARSLFKTMASACIACHSRSPAGSKLNWDFSSGFARGLPYFQQAELLAAGRSFEAALDALEKILADSEIAKKHPYDWTRALRFGLAISIRVDQSPSRALALLEKAKKTAGIPTFSKLDMEDWLRSLRTWKQETEKQKPPRPPSEALLNREAKRILHLAKTAQRYPTDRAGDILYLRATSLLHQQLQLAPSGERSGEAFFLLGVSYEVLRDFEQWNLNELFYEACIHRAPHTETAASCFGRLEESILLGYTGSSGTNLPPSAEKKLSMLRKMSTRHSTETRLH